MDTVVQIGRLALIALILGVWDRLTEGHGLWLDTFMIALIAWTAFMHRLDHWLLGQALRTPGNSTGAISPSDGV
jgi:hypothetical protein